MNQKHNEEWKDIPGYEGLYKINTNGEIKSLSKKVGRYGGYKTKEFVMKISSYKAGYKYVQLLKNDIRKKHKVHRLVMLSFVGADPDKPYVNHKNGIKSDNRLENLEWCTGSENNKHAFKTGLAKALKGKDNKRSKPVNQYNMDGNFIARYDGLREAMRQTGCGVGDIAKCCKGRKMHVKFFIWRYAA